MHNLFVHMCVYNGGWPLPTVSCQGRIFEDVITNEYHRSSEKSNVRGNRVTVSHRVRHYGTMNMNITQSVRHLQGISKT